MKPIFVLSLALAVYSISSDALSLTPRAQNATHWNQTDPTRGVRAANGVMMQYFEWYVPTSRNLWNQMRSEAGALRSLGVSAVWIPPAYKGAGGANDVGYAVYDKYDLGEFNQKGSVRTHYGTLGELKSAIAALKSNGMQVYGDIVINHLVGADETEWVCMRQVSNNDRNYVFPNSNRCSNVWSRYTFPGRGGVHSNFVYTAGLMSGTDGPNLNPNAGGSIFVFDNHWWSQNVDWENGNYDYLLGMDLDYNTPAMRDEGIRWGKWFTTTLGLDGYRIDAVKHVDAPYMRTWVQAMRQHTGREMFSVGEFWSGDKSKLLWYLNQVSYSMSLFDVGLHYNFHAASRFPDSYDIRKIFDNSLVQSNPMSAVTFVDNHDTQPGQSLESFVQNWFKPIAYAMILTRQSGYPCIFYGDYYGGQNMQSFRDTMNTLLWVRQNYAYGQQQDFFVSNRYIGWTREGDASHGGLAAVVSTDNYPEGYLDMNVGRQYANRNWREATGRFPGREVFVGSNGSGRFPVKGKSVAIWIPN